MKYKAWVCRDRQLGRKGNGCQMRIMQETDLIATLCVRMGWDRFDEERVAEIGRVLISDEGVEVKAVQEKFTA